MSFAVVELAIGMVFVFLVTSLMVSQLTELLSSWTNWRASNLWKSLRAVLGGRVQEQLYAHPLVRTLVPPGTDPPWGLQWVQRVPGLRRAWPFPKGPSYIPSRTFAYAFLDLMQQPHETLAGLTAAIERAISDPTRVSAVVARLTALPTAGPLGALIAERVQPIAAQLNAAAPERVRGALEQARGEILELSNHPALFDADVQQMLRPLLQDVGGDVVRVRMELETWYNDVMDGVSGWYKRKTQAVHFAAGLLLAVTIDVDALLFARVFWTDSALRSAVAAQAEAFSRNPPSSLSASSSGGAEADFGHIRQELGTLAFPVRGSCPADPVPAVASPSKSKPWWCDEVAASMTALRVPVIGWMVPIQTNPLRWFGWMLTAVATSLGAPFWFDLMKKVISVRSTGRAPGETPMPPKEAPQPPGPGSLP